MNTQMITDSDMIILQSVESYLKQMGAPACPRPNEQLMLTQQARDYLYSDIVQRVPRIASYIMASDLKEDKIASGLFIALSKHAMDPIFINLLMQYLMRSNNQNENGIVGSLLAKIMNNYIESVTVKDKSKKETKDSAPDMKPIEHIQKAVNSLLGSLANIISTRCGNLSYVEALAVAACVAMNNKDTLTEIISSDLPITAQLFDVVEDPSNLIKSALLLDKNDFVKLTANQSAFIESLKRWVYDKLNYLPTQTSYQFLVSVYGSIKPDVSKYLIQIKDCGTQYSNLLVIAKQLINQ